MICSRIVHTYLYFAVQLTFQLLYVHSLSLSLTHAHTSLSCHSEKANFALTLTDKNGLLVAQASLYDYPNVEAVDQTAWEKWILENFDLSGTVVSCGNP